MTEHRPRPRLTAVTLGVRDFPASVRFYEALGFVRKMRATGDEIAFFDAGGVVLALFRWDQLAEDAALPNAGPAAGSAARRWHGIAPRAPRSMRPLCARSAAGARLLKPRRRPAGAAIPAISPIRTATPGRLSMRRVSFLARRAREPARLTASPRLSQGRATSRLTSRARRAPSRHESQVPKSAPSACRSARTTSARPSAASARR